MIFLRIDLIENWQNLQILVANTATRLQISQGALEERCQARPVRESGGRMSEQVEK